MRAVLVEQYDSIENIQIKEVQTPVPGAGQVLVKVKAASVGFVEGLKVRGLYQTKDPLPFTPGMEFSGVIEAISDDVEGLVPGTQVMGTAGNGALAEYVVANASSVYPMPDGLTSEIGASFYVNYLTALYALSGRAWLKPGERLLVLGATGGTGIAAIQVGKLMGAEVIAAASTQEKRDAAIRIGADATVDYTQHDWRDALKEATAGKGPDVIFDPVGGAIADQAFRSIAWNGRYIVVGFASGEIPALKFNLPLLKGGILVGVDAAQIEKREPEIYRQVMDQLLNWLESGALKPAVGEVFDFENFHEAFRRMQARTAIGKMVIRIS
ncbi:MAG: NADPH:quinone oxidoreductase family protein [Alphaproteobacteria bacterium]|nr:NADPH:quinone oxidoreductase family protein [Alphaproteobacteria bacterium]MBT4083834.1 NADPH:quinone oxidoreductase family protein [Alphaproteobacteria bacterium]MBT4542862.1 NADPH:quinone oxidoreductase family protein [Alphaproteobacteria bacterium]MBT7744238.1 NADPH:quinone oxidoreductase family protein [Alphaproteobacteria bacterium]